MVARVRWWPHGQDSAEPADSGGSPWRRPITGLAIRLVAAAVVLLPSAVLLIRLGEPFAISAMASTAAIVLHSPSRYRRRPDVIAWCYVGGLAIAIPLTVVATMTDLPGLYASAVAAVIIVATPLGRIHPPTACIPLAITASATPDVLLMQWAIFSSVAAGILIALWVLTLGARP